MLRGKETQLCDRIVYFHYKHRYTELLLEVYIFLLEAAAGAGRGRDVVLLALAGLLEF